MTVPAPEPRGIRYGLFTAAAGPLTLDDPHSRGGGVQYEPVSCGVAHLYPVDCPPGDVKVFDDGDDVVEAAPFVAYATLVCGAVGNTPAELEAKVRRRLTNGEQGVAELAMSNILAASATPTVDVGDPANIVATVAGLEEWLYGTQGYGNIGVLHAPVNVATYAAAHGLIVQDGLLKKTPYGTVWSIGGGYTGTLPGGAVASTQRPLLGQFYEYPGGPPVDLVGTPTITITPLAGGPAVVGPTIVGVTHPGTGAYGYVWAGQVEAGQYFVVWSGTDSESDTVTASEILTVDADDTTPGGLYISGHTTVWRASEVQVFPAAQTFDRAANQHYLLAEREYAVAYDCLAAGAPVAADVESS